MDSPLQARLDLFEKLSKDLRTHLRNNIPAPLDQWGARLTDARRALDTYAPDKKILNEAKTVYPPQTVEVLVATLQSLRHFFSPSNRNVWRIPLSPNVWHTKLDVIRELLDARMEFEKNNLPLCLKDADLQLGLALRPSHPSPPCPDGYVGPELEELPHHYPSLQEQKNEFKKLRKIIAHGRIPYSTTSEIHHRVYAQLVNALFDEDAAKTLRIEQKMRRGLSSESGFLAPHENLTDVIRADQDALDQMGITHEQLADYLHHFFSNYSTTPTETPRPQSQRPDFSTLQVDLERTMGYQLCPYAEISGRCPTRRPLFSNNSATVTNHGQTLNIPGLAVHLIADHHFCEGHVFYGVDPVKAAIIFGIPTRLTPVQLQSLLEQREKENEKRKSEFENPDKA